MRTLLEWLLVIICTLVFFAVGVAFLTWLVVSFNWDSGTGMLIGMMWGILSGMVGVLLKSLIVGD